MPGSGEVIRLKRGRYRLREKIAGSSHGEVWAASRFLRRTVALKFVRAERMLEAPSAIRAHWLDSMRRELRFLRSLAPHEMRSIVSLIDYGEWQGMPVVAMERMAGNLLEEINRRRGTGERVSLALAVDWLAQINTALQVVHRHGWRYLDLKPTNLLLSDDGRTIKVADFGENRRRVQAGGHPFCGTIGWQAPEQFFPAERSEAGFVYRTDHRADYFALGIIFYFIVTGGERLRFAGDCEALFARNGEEGAYQERERLTITLREEETERFRRCLEGDSVAPDVRDQTWVPGEISAQRSSRSRAPAMLAISLLESLLAFDAAGRPASGMEIARRIEHLQRTMKLHGLPNHHGEKKSRNTFDRAASALRASLEKL